MRLSQKIGIIAVLIISLLVVLNFPLFSKPVRNFFYLISEPIQKVFWQTGKNLANFFELIRKIKSLKKENEELKLEIQKLLTENISLKELKRENEILREALNLGLEKEWTLNLSQVIGKEISQDSLIINRGIKDGISKGMIVINEQKVLVGKIGEVYQNFSKVQLISHEAISFDAKILAPYQSEDFGGGLDTETFGLVKGKGNLKLSFELIPQGKEIKIGDQIITTALGGNFPPGLLVGEIKEIKKSDVTPFQEAKIKPAFEIEDLDFLFIITNF